MVQGTGVAASKKLTETFTGSAAFTSTETYLCTALRLTKSTPILEISYASGTEVTFEYLTGAANDTIRFQCTGN